MEDIISKTDAMIADFDALPKLIKARNIGMAREYEEELGFQKMLLDVVGRDRHHFEVVGVIGHISVFRCTNKDYEKYPYTSAYINNNEHSAWAATNCFWSSIEMAILDAIGHKHDGINTRYANYAGKMLDLEV